jgi:hypothetical protein
MFRFLRSKFAARCTDDAGQRVRSITVGSESATVCMDPTSGKLHSYRVNGGPGPLQQSAEPFWLGDEDKSVLLDLASERVLALVQHDGCRKYHPTVYVSFVRALRIMAKREGFLVSLLPFPRCGVELYQLRSMIDAEEFVELMLA